MGNEIIICVPGAWENRTKFIEALAASTRGDFMFAGMIFAHPRDGDHVGLEFHEPSELMSQAFEYGGQGKLSDSTLARIARHGSVVYLHFPFDLISQKARIVKFTEVLSRCGGIAVKLETCGVAHEWERWFELLRSGDPFDTYCAGVVLVGDDEFYYSCGMHNFGLPDVQISNSFDVTEAADLMNRFNYWQIVERPALKSGHTFSLTADAPRFRLELSEDARHSEEGDLFHNPHGVWELRRG